MTSVLVVDDDAQLRRALVRSLRVNGYEPAVAENYDEAIEQVQHHQYDVVLTDLRMAGKNGIELVAALNQLAPSTKAILMSAFASARDSQHALDLGAVSVLCKPFDTVEMLRAVDRAAESSSGFTGSVHGLSLLDMLQMFHCAKRSLTLFVAGSPPGSISMKSGQLVHASRGQAVGLQALREIVRMPAGSVESRALETGPRTIGQEFSEVLNELMTELSSRNRYAASPSDVQSILEGAPGLRSLAPVQIPASPAFPDVFGEFEGNEVAKDSGQNSGRANGTASGEELDAVNELCERVAGGVACAVLPMKAPAQLRWSRGNRDQLGWSEALPTPWVEAVQQLLSGIESPDASSAAPQLGQAPLAGEVQVALPEGVLLGKLTVARRTAILLIVGREADLACAWHELRKTVYEHESIRKH